MEAKAVSSCFANFTWLLLQSWQVLGLHRLGGEGCIVLSFAWASVHSNARFLSGDVCRGLQLVGSECLKIGPCTCSTAFRLAARRGVRRFRLIVFSRCGPRFRFPEDPGLISCISKESEPDQERCLETAALKPQNLLQHAVSLSWL